MKQTVLKKAFVYAPCSLSYHESGQNLQSMSASDYACCGAVPFAFLSLMVVAQVIRRYSGDAVNFLRWTLLMIVAAIVVTIYLIVFPRQVCPRYSLHLYRLLKPI